MKSIPKQIKNLVKSHKIIFSGKARHQFDTGDFDTDDLINSITHGEMLKKEKDETEKSQYKYTIVGSSCSGASIYSCGKIVKLFEKNYFIITFHKTR